jgi:Retrotransposon gag protein
MSFSPASKYHDLDLKTRPYKEGLCYLTLFKPRFHALAEAFLGKYPTATQVFSQMHAFHDRWQECHIYIHPSLQWGHICPTDCTLCEKPRTLGSLRPCQWNRLRFNEGLCLGSSLAAARQTPTAQAPRKSTVAVPEFYDGTPSKYCNFRRQAALCVGANGDQFSDDNAKMYFILSYLRGGTAGPWAEDQVDQAIAHPTGALPWANFDAFMTEFRERFGPRDTKRIAQIQLEQLHQGSKQAEDFLVELERLARNAEMFANQDAYLIGLLDKNANAPLIGRTYGIHLSPRRTPTARST